MRLPKTSPSWTPIPVTRIDPLPQNLRPDALLRSLGIESPKEIDVEAIAHYVGLRIKRRPLCSCEAMITGMGNRGIISIRPNTLPTRERFSIAHELGHWARDRGQSVACRSSEIGKYDKTNLVERAADQYAADLLMPWPLFKSECRKFTRLDLDSLKAVAKEFECSLTATLIRMIDSDIYPTAMMIHHTGLGRKWHRSSKSVPGYWFPKDTLDVESSAFELLHNPDARQVVTARLVKASVWFNARNADRYMITEQSFRVAEEGVITILRLDQAMIEAR